MVGWTSAGCWNVGRWDVGELAAVHYGWWVADADGIGTIFVRRGDAADRRNVDYQLIASLLAGGLLDGLLGG